MSVGEEQEQQEKTTIEQQKMTMKKVIGCKISEDEFQNVVIPTMHDCHNFGLIEHDTVSSFVRFCIKFWIGHYRVKKQQFEMSQQKIE
jgi:hypothetical protein